MSSSTNVRNSLYSDRRTSATLVTKPRVPSSRAEAKVQTNRADDIVPQDSASNTGIRRPASTSFKPNGSTTHTVDERQTERHHVTTRENVRLSVKSPLKGSVDIRGNTPSPKLREPVPYPVKPAEVKEKTLRKLLA